MFKSYDKDHMLIQVYHPCHIWPIQPSRFAYWQNSSSSALASDGKKDTALQLGFTTVKVYGEVGFRDWA